MAALVSGRVLDGDGAPVAGARVAFAAAPVALPDTALLTGPDGRFTLSAPAAGDYRLAAHGEPGAAERAVAIGDADVTDVELKLGTIGRQGDTT